MKSDDPTTSSSNSEVVEETVAEGETPDNETEKVVAQDDAPDEDAEDKADEVEEEKPSTEKRTHGGEPKGFIIHIGEDLKIPADRHENFAIVTKDVYREIQLRGSKRLAYQLVYTAGTAIPLSKLDEVK